MASLKSYYDRLPAVVRTTLWSAARAAVGVFALGSLPILGLLGQPNVDWSHARTAVIALGLAAAVAAVRVIQHAVQGTLKS